MQSVKKWDDFGTEEIIPFVEAVTETHRQETILQQGFQMNADNVHYKVINSVWE